MIGELAKAIAPMMGNAFLAASLKNSLRDWSSSFCFFAFIIIKFFVSPTHLTAFRVAPFLLTTIIRVKTRHRAGYIPVLLCKTI